MSSGCSLPCFDCLRQRIESDISPDAVFLYGLSGSALNLGNAAVLQCSFHAEESVWSEDASIQLVLVQLLGHENRCLKNGFSKDTVEKNAQLEDTKCSSKQYLYEDGLNADITLTGIAPSSQYGDRINDSLSLLGFRGHNLQCSSINCFEKFSCYKILSLLSPQANSCSGSYTEIKNLICKYLSGSTEEYVVSSLHSFVEGKSSDQQSLNFLSLIGFPYFGAINIPYCSRQPNISPLVGIINTPGYDYLLHPKAPFTLEDILHYSPNSLKSDWHIRFLIYQIFSALTYMHDLGIVHGNVCPSSILLSDSLWAWLSLADMPIWRGKIHKRGQALLASGINHHGDCLCEKNHCDLKLSAEIDWHSNFMKWWRAELSNYDYLLVLNKLAGRRWGDRTFHIVMPWVIDFSVKPDEKSDIGWRDLKKSKWRLAKGDEQLDFSYSTSEIPHHVSDECLSELAVCSYKARRLPLKILRSAVRSVYEPNEYPSNMQRLYQWTPDECIPDFYTDPQIFFSIHSEMSDLAVPSWASSPEEFILQHRSALESDHVSRHIHHWIDITFGYKLSGEASIAAKNVMLPVSDPSLPRSMGRRQLFTRPHPVRQTVKSCSNYVSNKEYLVNSNEESDNGCALIYSYKDYQLPDFEYLGNLEKAISFCEASRSLSAVYSYDKKNVEDSPDWKNIAPSNMDKLNPCNYGKTTVDNTYLNTCALEATEKSSSMPLPFSLGHLLDFFESDDNSSTSFQDLLRWSHLSSFSRNSSEEFAGDIFSVGCLIAELYLVRPLFDPISLRSYKEVGVLPGHMQELPPCIAVLVEAAIQRDWKRRFSAKYFLESPYFPASVRGAYLFLAPLQFLSKPSYRLWYAAKLAREGALKAMGANATEMCVAYCLPLIKSALSDFEADSAVCLLKEFLKCLDSHAIRALLFPTIQNILQAQQMTQGNQEQTQGEGFSRGVIAGSEHRRSRDGLR